MNEYNSIIFTNIELQASVLKAESSLTGFEHEVDHTKPLNTKEMQGGTCTHSYQEWTSFKNICAYWG